MEFKAALGIVVKTLIGFSLLAITVVAIQFELIQIDLVFGNEKEQVNKIENKKKVLGEDNDLIDGIVFNGDGNQFNFTIDSPDSKNEDRGSDLHQRLLGIGQRGSKPKSRNASSSNAKGIIVTCPCLVSSAKIGENDMMPAMNERSFVLSDLGMARAITISCLDKEASYYADIDQNTTEINPEDFFEI